jgi:hypothetical protein
MVPSSPAASAISTMLGHSSATVTLDTYSHVFPSMAEELSARLDAVYRESDVDQMWTKPRGELVPLAQASR